MPVLRLLPKSAGLMPLTGAFCAWTVLATAALVTSSLAMTSLAKPSLAADVNLSFVDGEGADVQDVIATLSSANGQNEPPPAPVEAEVNQYRQAFEPLVTAVPLNSDVAFRNSDNFAHHVYSFSKAKSFEHRQATRGVSEAETLDKPGLIALGCNIHDHMLAYIYVSDTPHYGLSGKEGTIQMQDVPDGEYLLTVWHPRLKGKNIEKTVTVSGDTLEMRETLDLKPPRKVKKSVYNYSR